MKSKTIGEIIEREVRKQQIPITQFADMICCQRNKGTIYLLTHTVIQNGAQRSEESRYHSAAVIVDATEILRYTSFRSE